MIIVLNGHKSSETRKLAIDYYLSNNISQLEVSKIFTSHNILKRLIKSEKLDHPLPIKLSE